MSKGGGKNGRSVSYFRFDTLVAISLQMEPVTRVTSERTAYNELKIEERERERERMWKSESTEFPRVIKGSRSCLANAQTNNVNEI